MYSMNDCANSRDKVEQAVQHCYSTWSDSYYRDYYQSDAAYPPVHTQIVRDELTRAGVASVLDAGCGPASMLRDLNGLGLDRYGFDLTVEMVVEARRVMAAQNVPESHIWDGSVLDQSSFRTPSQGYGAAICFGVLPHIPTDQDATALANLTAAVQPGGLVLVEARNQLFALFTLNRYSRDFFRETLIDEAALRAEADPEEAGAIDVALEELDHRFRVDLPPVRTGKLDEPGYDQVLSRTHNPFEMKNAAEAAGLVDVETLFYHYHALPPLVEGLLPRTFRDRSLALESPRNWRGHFLASAFILKGRKAPQ
jgi:2-polyprenyl-3-methyl-5-hydroxy-6-metoxy-1,4-benzoquinol methylase